MTNTIESLTPQFYQLRQTAFSDTGWNYNQEGLSYNTSSLSYNGLVNATDAAPFFLEINSAIPQLNSVEDIIA